MPTYSKRCALCDIYFEQWQSIHDDTPIKCPHCNFPKYVETVFERVNTYGVGPRGAETVRADAMDRKIDEARPSYARMRKAGLQPPTVLDSPRLERHADDPMYVESGGVVAVPEHRRTEIKEMMAEATHSDWNPVEQVHAEKGT